MNKIAMLDTKTKLFAGTGVLAIMLSLFSGNMFQKPQPIKANAATQAIMSIAGNHAEVESKLAPSPFLDDFMAFVSASIDEYIPEAQEESKVHFVVSHPYDQSKASCLDVSGVVNL